ncbi:hypothetical protein M8J76_004687 [Diaphorina citri]|nr:hypothetical protein M8J76_004687 [Diaphorina citri]
MHHLSVRVPVKSWFRQPLSLKTSRNRKPVPAIHKTCEGSSFQTINRLHQQPFHTEPTRYLYVSSTKLLSFIFEIWDNPPLKAELEDFCCNLLITELLEKDIYWSKIGSDKWNAFLIFSISCRILIAAVSGLDLTVVSSFSSSGRTGGSGVEDTDGGKL